MKRVLSAFLIRMILMAGMISVQPVPVHAQITTTCGASAIVTTTSSGALQMIPVGRSIRICSVVFQVAQSGSPVDFSLVQGTGTNCATGQAVISQVFYGVASSTQVYAVATLWYVPGNTAVCLLLSGSPTKASAQVSYEYF